MKAYITIWAMTKGIIEVEAVPRDWDQSAISWNSLGFTRYAHGEGNEWHRTRESAVKRAEAMRVKRIAALEKQIKKLRWMKFE